MKTITNKTHKPLKVSLPGGKFLHLGPLKSGQIADGAAGTPAIEKLVKAGEIEIVGDGAGSGTGGAHGKPGSGKSASQGHTPKMVRSSGDR